MSEMGFNCFRTSISWGRIFPNGDDEEPNEAGLNYYEEMFNYMLELGMEPVITISHYETPIHLVEQYGGWKSRELICFFEKYCRTLFNRYKDLVKYWMTFNEINNVHTIPFAPAAKPPPYTGCLVQTVSHTAYHHPELPSHPPIPLLLPVIHEYCCSRFLSPPFEVFSNFLRKKDRHLHDVCLCGIHHPFFLILLFYDLFQLFSSFGAFDVDDLLLNCFGAMLGYWGWLVFGRRLDRGRG